MKGLVVIIVILIFLLMGTILVISLNPTIISTSKEKNSELKSVLGRISIGDCSILDNSGKLLRYDSRCSFSIGYMTKDKKTCKNFPGDDYSRDMCFNGIAAANKDDEYCYSLGKTNMKDMRNNCFLNVAVVKQDMGLCNEILGSWPLVKTCYKTIAHSTHDPSQCVVEGIDKEDCYLEVASSTRDISVCDSIKDTDKKDYCILSTIGSMSIDNEVSLLNPDLCSAFPVGTHSENWCLSYIAKKNKNRSICEQMMEDDQIEYHELYNSCFNFCPKEECFADVAVLEKDYALCDEKVFTSNARSRCYGKIAASLGDSIEICDTFEDVRFAKSASVCKWTYIKNSGDPTYCDQYENEDKGIDYYNRCVEAVVYQNAIRILEGNVNENSNVKACNLLENSFQNLDDPQAECGAGVAVLLKDYLVCNELEDVSDKEFCVAYYKALRDRNPSFCKDISDKDKRKWCLSLGPDFLKEGEGKYMPHRFWP